MCTVLNVFINYTSVMCMLHINYEINRLTIPNDKTHGLSPQTYNRVIKYTLQTFQLYK